MENTVFIINKYVAKGNINMQLFFDCNQYLEGEVQNVFFSYENAKELFEEYESFYDPNTVETVVYTLEEYTIENPMSEQELKAELNDSLEQLIDIDFNPVYKCTVMQAQSNPYKIISEEGKYDYENAIKGDIMCYLHNIYSEEELKEKLKNESKFLDDIFYDFNFRNTIPGNDVLSYTKSQDQAKAYLKGNEDLLREAYKDLDSVAEFGEDYIFENYQKMDRNIRRALLSESLCRAINTIKEEFKAE